MKKILSVFLTITFLMTFCMGSVQAQSITGAKAGKAKYFSDIQGHWGQASILKVQSRGLLFGYEDGSFRPDNPITQDELAVLIEQLLEKKQNMARENGTDLDDDNDEDADDDNDINDDEDLKGVPGWAKKAVQNGIKHNYINLKRFHSQVQVDRLTACVELAKALEDEGLLEPATDYDNNPFADTGLFEDDDDYGYVLALYYLGYIKGAPNGNFNPNSLLRRAEMASIIAQILDEDVSDDETEPTWPSDSSLIATNIGATRVTLSWTAASDNEKVIAYKIIFVGNGETKTKLVGLTRSTTITGLEPDEEYEFTVEARDAAGNWSDDGPSKEVTTKESSAAEDTTKPHWSNETLTASNITSSRVTLKWSGAADNVEVTRYRIYIDNDLEATIDADVTSKTITDLDADTEYTFRVEAGDDAGNWSTDGPEENFSTID